MLHLADQELIDAIKANLSMKNQIIKELEQIKKSALKAFATGNNDDKKECINLCELYNMPF